MSGSHTTESLWEEFGERLYRFLRRRVSGDEVARDLLQEIFLRVHANLGTLRDGDRIVAWLHRIARNVLADRHRQGSRSPDPLDDDPAATPEDGGSFEFRSLGTWLIEQIEDLPAGYREALELSEIRGLSRQEIARRLGLTASGAKTRVVRGRKLLRRLLERSCRIELDARGNVIDCQGRANSDCGDC